MPHDQSWDDEPDYLENESGLDALYSRDSDDHPGMAADETVESMVFTVANPRGTVSVTALPNGQPFQINLTPAVVSMTESELAEEISVIAQLAQQNALAGQHLMIATMMSRMGLDPAAVRSHLERELRLPSPETALTEKAEIFAARYPFAEG